MKHDQIAVVGNIVKIKHEYEDEYIPKCHLCEDFYCNTLGIIIKSRLRNKKIFYETNEIKSKVYSIDIFVFCTQKIHTSWNTDVESLKL